MPTFEQGDIVRVPFPYTDLETKQYRPALVVSRAGIGGGGALLWVVMITSASNRSWHGDVPIIEGYRNVGLPAPSLIRTTKIATIESGHADRIGRLSAKLWKRVQAQLRAHLGLE